MEMQCICKTVVKILILDFLITAEKAKIFKQAQYYQICNKLQIYRTYSVPQQVCYSSYACDLPTTPLNCAERSLVLALNHTMTSLNAVPMRVNSSRATTSLIGCWRKYHYWSVSVSTSADSPMSRRVYLVFVCLAAFLRSIMTSLPGCNLTLNFFTYLQYQLLTVCYVVMLLLNNFETKQRKVNGLAVIVTWSYTF